MEAVYCDGISVLVKLATKSSGFESLKNLTKGVKGPKYFASLTKTNGWMTSNAFVLRAATVHIGCPTVESLFLIVLGQEVIHCPCC
jgi:hypothetical protein